MRMRGADLHPEMRGHAQPESSVRMRSRMARHRRFMPACGFVSPPLDAAEELIAFWVVTSSLLSRLHRLGRTAPASACTTSDHGPLSDGDRVLCPACGDPWQDRGGIIEGNRHLRMRTGDPAHRTTSEQDDDLPKCRSLLGCPIDIGDVNGRTVRRSLTSLPSRGIALGYASASALWEVACPLAALSRLGCGCRRSPGRRRHCGSSARVRYYGVGSIRQGCRSAWRYRPHPCSSPGMPGISHPSALRSRRTFSRSWPFASVSRCRLRLPWGVPGVLILDPRWRPEPSWIDRLGRGLGIYWLAAESVVPILPPVFLSIRGSQAVKLLRTWALPAFR